MSRSESAKNLTGKKGGRCGGRAAHGAMDREAGSGSAIPARKDMIAQAIGRKER